ncbi:MAG: type 4a pilus biogenesis protein PilO [Rhodoferax sp.]|jgi:type IV pilus assembly protein PilO|nr:type 4a pilus biogenesis protein PilO [Rhodoferax sp.]MCL4738174.1 type 4a pilus biogenesis protein PilO [Burkholderiaceae bacterium]MCP5288075.1 type 4a pilus biogenesis protein PilO [Burkholderiaceae bacterium]HMQ70977.1 type 4a pilus biogenesis protein PilO [Rubrivivax sp.]
MAKTTPTQTGPDLSMRLEKVSAQFRGLDMREPGQWPLAPKAVAWLVAALLVLAAGWWFLVAPATEELDAARSREQTLRADYRSKVAQAVNLGELRKQKLQVEEYVTQLEKQLPGKAEMDALLSDINQAGIGRGLQFELFRPGQVELKDYYAVLPITLRVSGRYHDFGAFAADVSNLSRIVTLQNLSISSQTGRDALPGGALVMEATARTYRYLDVAEIEAQRKQKAEAAKAAKAAGGRRP